MSVPESIKGGGCGDVTITGGGVTHSSFTLQLLVINVTGPFSKAATSVDDEHDDDIKLVAIEVVDTQLEVTARGDTEHTDFDTETDGIVLCPVVLGVGGGSCAALGGSSVNI